MLREVFDKNSYHSCPSLDHWDYLEFHWERIQQFDLSLYWFAFARTYCQFILEQV